MTQQRANFGDRMAGYVEVADRITAFYERFPDGSLQSEVIEFTPDVVLVKAWAYRTPDDAHPGIGHSSMLVPGSTPYTRGSEVENAETSAWGRAIAALGFEVRRGVASRDEIEGKQGQRQGPPERGERTIEPPQPRSAQNRPVAASEDEREGFIQWAFNTHGLGLDVVLGMLKIEPARFMVLTADELKRASVAIEEKLGTPA